MPDTKIKHQAGLGGAAHERGASFIQAALLILDNLPESKQQEINHLGDQLPLRIELHPHGKGKTNIELLKDYIKTLDSYWKQQNPRTMEPNDLAQLERTLIETINQNIYFNNQKDFKAVKQELDNAENHVNWKPRAPLQSITNFSEQQTTVRIEDPIQHFTDNITNEWRSILTKNAQPEWFIALPAWEQNYLQQRVRAWDKQKNSQNGVQNLGEFLGNVPTTIRRYPGAPNAYVTKVEIVNGNKTESFLKVRSGVIAPAAMKAKGKAGKAEKVRLAKENLEQLVAAAINAKIADMKERDPDFTGSIDLPVLFQTLYSPPFQPPGAYNNAAVMKAVDLVKKDLENPKEFFQKQGIDTQGITLNKIDLLYTNRAVNNARGLTWVSNLFNKQGKETRHTEKMLSKYVEELGNRVGKDHKDYLIAKAALDSYKNMPYLGNTIGSVPPTKQNALAEKAALEQVIANKIGIRVGSCVSGKDREEMITEIAIAQQEFFLEHGKFPPPHNATSKNDKQLRDDFMEKVARQYLTGHGHALAAENSKGCDGLKNIVDVMGKGICDKIREKAPEYKIDMEKFDPIKTVQKVAGLNKLNVKKLDVSIEGFVETVKSSPSFNAIKHPWKRAEVSRQSPDQNIGAENSHPHEKRRTFSTGLREHLQSSTVGVDSTAKSTVQEKQEEKRSRRNTL